MSAGSVMRLVAAFYVNENSGLGIRISGLGVRNSGLGIRNSGLGRRNSGVGFRNLVLTISFSSD